MKALKANRRQNQKGFASLVIALILVLVLSLMTIGFADLMRKEERSALDRHLSSQAYYAAEAGINDALKALSDGFSKSKPLCGPWTGSGPGSDKLTNNKVNVNDSSNAVSYPCLTIDPQPLEVKYSPIDTPTAKVTEITGVDPNTDGVVPIGELIIGWQDVDSNAAFAMDSAHPFKPTGPGAGTWSYNPVLRIGLTPILANASRDSLIASTASAFLYPLRSGSGAPALPTASDYNTLKGPTDSGAILDGNCDTGNNPNDAVHSPSYCNVKITGLNANNYLLYLRSVYGRSSVRVRAFDTTPAHNPLRIRNAQTVIDSTGKAQDVLRRIQVRVPPRALPDTPGFVLETASDICKQLQLTPTGVPGSGSGC